MEMEVEVEVQVQAETEAAAACGERGAASRDIPEGVEALRGGASPRH